MSETLIPEARVRQAPDGAAVMNQLPAGSHARAESPLHHADFAGLAADAPSAGGVTLRELALRGHLILRGDQSNSGFTAACARVLGVGLPMLPLTSAEKGDIAARWLSPDEWLVTVPYEKAYALEKALRSGAEGHFSVVNVSGGQTILTLSGPRALDVLKKSTPLDLHPREFPVGKVAGSVFAKSSVLLRRTGEESWELVVRRSFADYLWLWLQDASREYGLIVSQK